MGEVYRARDTRLKRDVALKVLPDSSAGGPNRMLRFQREAEMLASLNHPNIAHIYGVEERALADCVAEWQRACTDAVRFCRSNSTATGSSWGISATRASRG